MLKIIENEPDYASEVTGERMFLAKKYLLSLKHM